MLVVALLMAASASLGAHNAKPVLNAEHKVGHAVKVAAVKTGHAVKATAAKL